MGCWVPMQRKSFRGLEVVYKWTFLYLKAKSLGPSAFSWGMIEHCKVFFKWSQGLTVLQATGWWKGLLFSWFQLWPFGFESGHCSTNWCSLISNSCNVSPGYRAEELQLLKILSRKRVFKKKILEMHHPVLVSYLNVYCLKCIFLNQWINFLIRLQSKF